MPQAVEIQMPQMGESVTEGTVLEWHKREGEFVEEGETVVEVSTDKVDAEVPAPASGVITRILAPASGTITKVLAQPDETVKVGQGLAEMAAGAATTASGEGQAAIEAEPHAAPPAPEGDGHRASPVARRVAAKNVVDLGAVRGSGPGGKVTKADVLAAANGETGAPAAPAVAPAGETKPLRGPAG